jgi:hypothetical protein
MRKARWWGWRVVLVAWMSSGCWLLGGDDGYDGDDYIYEPLSVNSAPVAVISDSPSRVLVGGAATLSGEESYDPDGASLTYQWDFSSRPDGSTATLVNADQVVVSFTADVSGEYEVRLTVSDCQASGSITEAVACRPLPTVTALEPPSGPAGTVVRIVGTDFYWDFVEDAVFFNGVEATVTGWTETWLIMAAPEGGTTGPVELLTMGQMVVGPVYTYGDAAPQFGENLVANPSFEEGTAVGWLVDGPGYWQGDVTASVGADDAQAIVDGITPLGGDKMLKFVSSTVGAPSPQWNSSELFQIVDLRSFGSAIAAGNVIVDAGVAFNRVAGDAETDTRFALVVRAYAGDPTTLKDQWLAGEYLTQEAVALIHDQPGTWIRSGLEMTLPAGTQFVLVWLTAVENVTNDGVAPEYDGHFADMVSLSVRAP